MSVVAAIARRLTQRRPTDPPSSAPDLQPPFVIFVVVFQPRRRCIDAADTIGQRHRIDAAAANATQKRWRSDPGGNLIKKLTLQRRGVIIGVVKSCCCSGADKLGGGDGDKLIRAEAGWCWTAGGGGRTTVVDGSGWQWTAVDGSGLKQTAVGNGSGKCGGRRRFDGMVIVGSSGVDGVDEWLIILFFLTRAFNPLLTRF